MEGSRVPELYRGCEIVPMTLFDLYGISFLVRSQYRENDLIRALIRHFTGKISADLFNRRLLHYNMIRNFRG